MNVDKFDTTIGELVAALSDVAFEVCADKGEASFLVALALKSLLRRAQGHKAPCVAIQPVAAAPDSLVAARSAKMQLRTFISSGTRP